MKKKTLILAVSILLVSLMVAGGTLAYFTDKQEIGVQKITTGRVDIKAVGGSFSLTNLVPGDDVGFTNNLAVSLETGSNDAYIRIKPTIEVKRKGQALADGEVKTQVLNFFKTQLNMRGEYIGFGVENTPFKKLDSTTNSVTVQFNDNAKLPVAWDNEYTDISVDISFTVEAIQADNVSPTDPFGSVNIKPYN